jgi:hypothetical protein
MWLMLDFCQTTAAGLPECICLLLQFAWFNEVKSGSATASQLFH